VERREVGIEDNEDKGAPAMKDGGSRSCSDGLCQPEGQLQTFRDDFATPSRTTRGFGVRSLRSVDRNSPSVCARPFDGPRRHAIIK